MNISLIVESRGNIFDLSQVCAEEITLSTYKKGRASCLCFTVARNIAENGSFSFFEGDKIRFSADNVNLFIGYVFSKTRSHDHFIKVYAYDQLRYLKNRNTYNYSFKTAGDVVKMIASDFKLNTGIIEDTGYIINQRIEENQTLFDIIMNALDLTERNTGNKFVLFDDFGNLSLKSEKNMTLPFISASDDGGMIDFHCTTDIDSDTFNQIKLYQRNKTKKIDNIIVVKNDESIKDWGILQYYKKVPDEYNDAQIVSEAEYILKQKNRVRRSLEIECIGTGHGEIKIRAGSRIFVRINDIGEEALNSYMCVNECIHTFRNNEHIIRINMEEGYSA